jgi:hypothetical protein
MALSKNDLRGTIADLISIDEFEPKTGTKSEIIVVAFYAIDESPAKDLDTYLERSHLNLIDVEVSPNPNEDGYYLIFIEMKRNNEFFPTFYSLVKDVERVSDKMDWKISPYLSDNLYELEDSRWEKFVIVDKSKYKTKDEFLKLKGQAEKQLEVEEAVKKYFKNSHITLLEYKKGNLKVGGDMGVLSFKVKAFCSEKKMMEKYDFNSKPILWESSSTELRALKLMLGNGWTAFHHDGDIVVSNSWSNTMMRLK